MSDSNRTATVTAPTMAIAPMGRAFQLRPGTYQIVNVDGAAERGAMYIRVDGPGGGSMVGVDPTDRNITISERA